MKTQQAKEPLTICMRGCDNRQPAKIKKKRGGENEIPHAAQKSAMKKTDKTCHSILCTLKLRKTKPKWKKRQNIPLLSEHMQMDRLWQISARQLRDDPY